RGRSLHALPAKPWPMNSPPQSAPFDPNAPLSLSAGTKSRPLPGRMNPDRLLAAIVEGSDDAILAKDLKGVILSWNGGAERLYGYTAAEAIGRSVSFLVPPGVEDDTPILLARVRRGERIRHYETVRRHRDGRHVQVSLTVSPIRDDGSNVIGGSTIARDISALRAEQQRLRLLSDLGRALSEELDEEQVLRELATRLVPEV